MAITKSTAFKNRSNIESYAIKKNGVAFDLVAADYTRIEVIAGGVAIDSDTTDVVFIGSNIDINYCAFDIPAGEYFPIIVGYTATDTKGRVLFGPDMDESIELLLRN
jgi:hypothetical protein